MAPTLGHRRGVLNLMLPAEVCQGTDAPERNGPWVAPNKEVRVSAPQDKEFCHQPDMTWALRIAQLGPHFSISVLRLSRALQST